MDSSGDLASPKGYGEANVASARRGPLHVCAVSFMAISHRIYTKAQSVKGPIGITAQRIAILATFASPLVYVAQYLFLAALSSVDDCILAYEDIVGSLFPRSNYVFDKIEELVQITERLPGEFDVLINKFPTMVYLVPFLDWALVHLITWLNFLVCELAAWGLENPRENGILIDKNYSKQNQEPAVQLPVESITLLPNKNKESITNETYEDDGVVGLTVITNESYKKDARAHPVSENGSSNEDEEGMVQPVSEKGSYEKDGMAQAVSEKESRKEDDMVSFTGEPVTERESYEEYGGMVETQSGLYKEDSIKGLNEEGRAGLTIDPISMEQSIEEESIKRLSEGRAGLMIEPINTEESIEEENRVCFTIQPNSSTGEEEAMDGFTVKPAKSLGSNMVGLAIQPISKKGSYKDVLERGKKVVNSKGKNVARKGYGRAAKDRVEWGWPMNTRRAPTKGQNGKKKRTNFPRSASYT